MKISQKGLYALQAMMMLARHHQEGPIKIREIAVEEGLPEKFLEIILIELKNARLVESTRGARGGYRLRRVPSDIHLSEVMRVIDGPLAPFGDAEHLRDLISHDASHRALYKVFLAVRNSCSRILESTTLADVANVELSDSKKPSKKQKSDEVRAFADAVPVVSDRDEIAGLVRARS
jgi:Rrf2 family transcriptional regulator, cysteine metabolism repressor